MLEKKKIKNFCRLDAGQTKQYELADLSDFCTLGEKDNFFHFIYYIQSLHLRF